MIKSPYYFVPFSKDKKETKVFTPPNPELVSHDHPYEDGVSGFLEIELENTTPLYIRNAGDHRDYLKSSFLDDCRTIREKNQGTDANISASIYREMSGFANYVRPYSIGPKPAIPGTTLKGCIRTILQIISNGRCEPVNDRRYSLRSLDEKYKEDYRDHFKDDKVHAGWIRWNEPKNQYELIPCKQAKILQTELEQYANSNSVGAALNLGKQQDAQEKYEAWEKNQKKEPAIYVKGHIAHLKRPSKEAHKFDQKKGTPVFVGQIQNRDDNNLKDKSKKREYFFYDMDESKTIPISEKIWQGFLDSHEDTNRNPTASWKYWKEELAKNPALKIPVFYLTESGKNLLENPDAEVSSFGLSRLYRLPYKLSLHDAIPEAHRPPEHTEEPAKEGEDPYPDFQPDFPSLLLGEAREHRALKGRVSFGHLAISHSGGKNNAVITILGSPQPGYAPNYMKNGKTMMHEDAQLNGWKFYPARQDGAAPAHNPLPTDNLKVATAFEPLSQGNQFKGKVRFHNLRPHELGALIWALTFGGREECRHRLGMAKPLGYGCAKISILGGELIPNQIPDENTSDANQQITPEQVISFSQTFESWITQYEDMQDWLNSTPVKTLLALTRYDHGVSTKQLTYPVMGMGSNNEFKTNYTLSDWLDLIPEDLPTFTLWPESMLPREIKELAADEFPGDDLREDALCRTEDLEEDTIYLCKVTKVSAPKHTARVQVVGMDSTSSGNLKFNGKTMHLFSRLQKDRKIALRYITGGSNNREFQIIG